MITRQLIEDVTLRLVSVSDDWLVMAGRVQLDEQRKTAVIDGVKLHYWTYPTSSHVAWASFCPGDNALRTEVEENVPRTIKDATAPREKHPMRKPQES